tara:strand:- start:161 stop:448 length:288 start_codon:yes stop_codon:yes gene_type:complete
MQLTSSVLSPLSNKRKDKYGGNLENRMRFPLEILDSIKSEITKEFPLGVRITGIEWENNGIDENEAAIFAKELEKLDVIMFVYLAEEIHQILKYQ